VYSKLGFVLGADVVLGPNKSAKIEDVVSERLLNFWLFCINRKLFPGSKISAKMLNQVSFLPKT